MDQRSSGTVVEDSTTDPVIMGSNQLLFQKAWGQIEPLISMIKQQGKSLIKWTKEAVAQ